MIGAYIGITMSLAPLTADVPAATGGDEGRSGLARPFFVARLEATDLILKAEGQAKLEKIVNMIAFNTLFTNG
jgi:hypothetical protein